MPTFEEVRARIQRNIPKGSTPRSDRELQWERETASTIVSLCGRYRISKMEDPKNPGIFGFGLALCATPTSAPKHLSGPFFSAKDAREAAQAHLRGEPLQADLA